MNDLLNKIEKSFIAITKGEESLHNIIWWWGAVGYLVAYFIANQIIKISDSASVDMAVSIVMSVYFIWHIYAVVKCSPKKPKLTKEEKKLAQIEARKDFGKKFMRKLLLKEPLTKWNSNSITIAIDLLCISQFATYIFR